MRRETPGNRAARPEADCGDQVTRPTPVEQTGTRRRAREGGPVRYSARVEYDGTDFAGFQMQARARTVQGELERSLARLTAGERVRVDGAGRTDAGVHAREQVIAFTYSGRLGRVELQRALSALLPPDIGLRRLRKVDRGFKPRHRARWREYRYFIWNGPPSPLQERFALGVREPIDAAAMAAAATVFAGRHDFSAFGGADRQPVRNVHRVRVTKSGRSVTIEVVGDAFLRQMVRRMVAALLRVGHGRATAADVEAALGDPGKAAFEGDTAPAHGLVLWRVPMNYEETQRGQRENDEQDIQSASE